MSRTNLIAALDNARTVAIGWDRRAELIRAVGAPEQIVAPTLKERAQHKQTVALIEGAIVSSVTERLATHIAGLVDALAEGCGVGFDVRQQTADTLAKIAATDISELMSERSAPAAAEPQPTMTQEQFVKSWNEPRDHAGVEELRQMSEQPAGLPDGVLALRGANEEELAKQVSEVLARVFRNARPSQH
ncbi:hypothetical protein [Caballeronia sp. SBC2]|uniref:hypothetical protein n=1 Tax=Caballeronia sp. SBC2 TaxID=2705547 RepID=UPI0013E198B2|nr:hypothetical protein [Caballeronia sp. SBC2]QIE22587.1 hypothetical protein SBC2_05970 [Caballeronia sp. SBC2]